MVELAAGVKEGVGILEGVCSGGGGDCVQIGMENNGVR